jgi:DNA repair photolyase
MSHPANTSILSLFSPLPAAWSLRGWSETHHLGSRITSRATSRILVGSIATPYLPEEGRRDLAQLREFLRSCSERSSDGARPELTIAITTRSPLLLHELDLLTELDREHVVGVDVLLPALDPGVVRELEPHLAAPPPPQARLELVRRLASEGIATRVLCVPLLPLLHGGTGGGAGAGDRRLDALFAAVREAGAWDLVTDLTAATADNPPFRRNRFRAWKRWSSSPLPLPSPRLHTRGNRHPQAPLASGTPGTSPPPAPRTTPQSAAESAEALLMAFNRLRLEYGFPRGTPGRG